MNFKKIVNYILIQIFIYSILLFSTDLSKEQKEIEKMLIAPCCWTSTIDVHPSQAAEDMKKEIAQFLKEGKTKKQILNYYVNKYGERILAVPQSPFQKYSVYTFPFIALVIGAILIIIFIRKSTPPIANVPLAPKRADKWAKKVEEELEKWD